MNKKQSPNKGSWQIPIAISCMLLGIMMTMLFKTQAQANFPMMSGNRNDMVKMVHDLEQQKQKLEADLEKTKKTLDEKFGQAAEKGGEEMLEAMRHQLDTVRTEAGYTDVIGQGVTIVLTDSHKRPAANEDDFFFRIHDVDIATLINELWASGAEAISVAGPSTSPQRIVINTPIRCVGPTVLINTVRVGSPYTVNAIGPAEDMEGALNMAGGFIDYMSPAVSKGATIKITKRNDVRIPAYKGSMILRYAKQEEQKDGPREAKK